MSRQAGLKLTGSLRKRLTGWYWSPSWGRIPPPHVLVSSPLTRAVNRTEAKDKVLCDAHSSVQWSIASVDVNILQGRFFDVAGGRGIIEFLA